MTASALVGNRLAETVAVIGCVSHDDLGWQVLDQCVGPRASPFCPAVRVKRTEHPRPRTAMWVFVFKPLGERPWPYLKTPFLSAGRVLVNANDGGVSTIKHSKSGSSDIASKMRHHTPLRLHRLKRRKTLFRSPNTSGRLRQGDPVHTIRNAPSTNIRLSRRVDPL
jgi:hypothetical protein